MHFALHILHKLGLATYLHAVPLETVKTDQIVAQGSHQVRRSKF